MVGIALGALACTLRGRHDAHNAPMPARVHCKIVTMRNPPSDHPAAQHPAVHARPHQSDYPRIVGHRGAGTLAPENTLASLRLAHALHCKGVEFDAMLGRDDEPVLMHDARLGRTVAGTQAVWALESSDLRERDAGAWFSRAHAGERVPSLRDALHLCMSLGLWMNLEIKPARRRDAARTGAAVARVLRECTSLPGTVPPMVVSSFEPSALAAFAGQVPACPIALLVGHVPRDWAARVAALEAGALHVNAARLTRRRIEALRASGLRILAYTVNDPDRAAELLAWGVDAICTDRPDLMHAALHPTP